MGAVGKIILVLLFLLHKSSQQQAFNDQKTLNLPDNYNIGWMAPLEDEKLLSKITIPGTHDTMAVHWLPPAACQSWSLQDQLKAGIRYLDLRVSGENLKIKHGWIDLKTTFPDALNTIKSFLSKFKTETVLVRVKPVSFFEDRVPKLVENVIKKDYSDSWIAKEIPTIGQVRGKIVFVQKNSFKLGVPLLETDKKGDYKVIDIEKKKKNIIAHLNEASQSPKTAVVLNYSSGTGWPLLRFDFTPKSVARKINPWLYDHLGDLKKTNPKPCFGVIAMDYPGFDLIQKVIEFNE